MLLAVVNSTLHRAPAMGLVFVLVFLGLFLWAINALSVLRNQMNEAIARLERIEQAQKQASTHRFT